MLRKISQENNSLLQRKSSSLLSRRSGNNNHENSTTLLKSSSTNNTSLPRATSNFSFDDKGVKFQAKRNLYLVSSGWESVDNALGGGLPIGSLLLLRIESMESVGYGDVLTRTFLSEGHKHKHKSIFSSQSTLKDPIDWLSLCPIPNNNENDNDANSSSNGSNYSKSNVNASESMKIAWRYENLEISKKNSLSVKNGNANANANGKGYDLSQGMGDQWARENIDIIIYNAFDSDNDSYYEKVLSKIRKIVNESQSSTINNQQQRITRLVLHDLFHPSFWLDCMGEREKQRALAFLLELKILLRQSFCVCILTTSFDYFFMQPNGSKVYDKFSFALNEICDAVVGIKAIEANDPLANEYQGYFRIQKAYRINSLAICIPTGNMLLAFKCRKKHFTLEKISLPPDLSETVSRSSTSSTTTSTSTSTSTTSTTTRKTSSSSASCSSSRIGSNLF